MFRDPNPERIGGRGTFTLNHPIAAATPESAAAPVPTTPSQFFFPSPTTFKPNTGRISAPPTTLYHCPESARPPVASASGFPSFQWARSACGNVVNRVLRIHIPTFCQPHCTRLCYNRPCRVVRTRTYACGERAAEIARHPLPEAGRPGVFDGSLRYITPARKRFLGLMVLEPPKTPWSLNPHARGLRAN